MPTDDVVTWHDVGDDNEVRTSQIAWYDSKKLLSNADIFSRSARTVAEYEGMAIGSVSANFDVIVNPPRDKTSSVYQRHARLVHKSHPYFDDS